MLVAATLVVVGIMAFGVPALAGTMLTAANMTGAKEVPGPGDPDGTGTADLNLIPKREKICYTITVNNIQPATMAHTQSSCGPERSDRKGTEGAERRRLPGVRQARPREDHEDQEQPVRVLRQRTQYSVPERRREGPALS